MYLDWEVQWCVLFQSIAVKYGEKSVTYYSFSRTPDQMVQSCDTYEELPAMLATGLSMAPLRMPMKARNL